MLLSAAHLETLDRIGSEILELQYEAQRLRLWLTLETAFRPDQLRVPAGNPDGGEWTREGPRGDSTQPDGADQPSPDASEIVLVSDTDDPPGIGHNSEPSGVDQNLDDDPEHTKPAEEPTSILGVLLRTSAATWALIAVELAAARALLRANTVAEPLSGAVEHSVGDSNSASAASRPAGLFSRARLEGLSRLSAYAARPIEAS